MNKGSRILSNSRLSVSREAFAEEIKRINNKLNEYHKSGINPDEQLYLMYYARRDALFWLSKMDEGFI